MPTGIALTIGLNSVDPAHYQGWSGDLIACEADANDMAAIATASKFITKTLLTKAATLNNVANEISSAATKLGAGDIFMLTYSGHGGQLPDLNGDEPDDLQDETWCLYDSQLVDDQLSEFWTKFADGVRVLVFSDSCHSGTVTKTAYYGAMNATGIPALPAGVLPNPNEAPALRVMPPEVALRTYRANRSAYDPILKKGARATRASKSIAATVRLISGCQDNQLSSDGNFNGLFTGTLRRVWNDGSFKGNYAEFHKAILKRMPPYQSPNHYVIGTPNPRFDAETPFKI